MPNRNNTVLENYYPPGDLEAHIAAFVAGYNDRRYYESIGNLTPADVYFGRGQTILLERERIKRQTIQNRRLIHRTKAASFHRCARSSLRSYRYLSQNI